MWRSRIEDAGRPGGRGFLRCGRGAAAAEFALVFPVFMLCLFGITAFASTLFLENNMVNAARESVRQMAVLEAPFSGSPVQCDAPEAQVAGTAEHIACAYLTFWGTDFTVQAGDTCSLGGDKATVRITLDASEAAVMDIFGFFNGKTLTAEVTMRKEDPCA